MSEKQHRRIFSRLGRFIGRFGRALRDGWGSFWVRLRNRLRRWRRAHIDYIVIPIGGPLPERAGPQRGFLARRLPLPSRPLSMQQLNARLHTIGDADNVKGVIFIFRGFQTGLATIQNFRRSVERLRENGKEVVVFTPYLDLRHYYAAAAANRVIAPPGTQFEVLGLHTEAVFLKDALQQIGVEVDVVQVSPFKTAFDPLQYEAPTPEYRAQIEWLLDDLYDLLTADMAADRGLSKEAFQALVDGAPYATPVALQHGLLDAVAYEDELEFLLAEPEAAGEPQVPEPEDLEKEPKRPAVKLRTWRRARGLLTEKYRRRPRRFIGVVSVQGLITMGASRRPPINLPIPFLGGATAGEQSLTHLLRKLAKIDRLAALILYVDSGGGSSLASDLVGREVERLSRKLPVVVYMGDVAASGGYYISASAQHIICQTTTTTGSIGVITLRPNTSGLYERLQVNRISLKRGAHADLYTDLSPMSEEEREVFRQLVEDNYQLFKQVVAAGRNLPLDELDSICSGRVWTGRQARVRKLVDSHGDFVDAERLAAELAGLPVDDDHRIPVANLYARDESYVLPEAFAAAEEIGRLLSREWLHELSGRPLRLMPFDLTFR